MAVAPTGVISPANVRVMNGGPGIVVGEGSVIDSVAKYNASGAAVVGLIVRGTVSTNNIFGIFIRPGGVASNNTSANNAVGGISLNNATAIGNTAYNNAGYGIDAVCPGALTGNTAYKNTGGNINTNGLCATLNNAQ